MTINEIMKLNPYSEEYFQECLKYYNSRNLMYEEGKEKKVESGKALLYYRPEIFGRLDGYMFKDFRKWENFPALIGNGTLWMSVTPMEIASHYNPIKLAKGKVATAGLGLGYFVQMILDKPEVKKIDVYEINEDIINLYNMMFPSNPKVNIIKGDIHKLKKLEDNYDFFYNDIYEGLIEEEKVIPDYIQLMKTGQIKDYWFWGTELSIMQADECDDIEFPALWAKNTQKLMVMLVRSKFYKLYSVYQSDSEWVNVDFDKLEINSDEIELDDCDIEGINL